MKKTISLITSLMLSVMLCACFATSEGTPAAAATETAAPEQTAETQATEQPAETSEPESETETAITLSAEEIDKLLTGTWQTPDGSNDMSFENGNIVITGGGQMLSGTYEIDPEQSAVIGHITTSDATLKITLPITYENDALHVFNNRNVELIKK